MMEQVVALLVGGVITLYVTYILAPKLKVQADSRVAKGKMIPLLLDVRARLRVIDALHQAVPDSTMSHVDVETLLAAGYQRYAAEATDWKPLIEQIAATAPFLAYSLYRAATSERALREIEAEGRRLLETIEGAEQAPSMAMLGDFNREMASVALKEAEGLLKRLAYLHGGVWDFLFMVRLLRRPPESPSPSSLTAVPDVP